MPTRNRTCAKMKSSEHDGLPRQLRTCKICAEEEKHRRTAGGKEVFYAREVSRLLVLNKRRFLFADAVVILIRSNPNPIIVMSSIAKQPLDGHVKG